MIRHSVGRLIICLFFAPATYTLTIPTISIFAEVSIGELLDKITILQIKSERFTDDAKLSNVREELHTLLDTLNTTISLPREALTLVDELKQTNEKMWEIEDDIRAKERDQEFDQAFITLARNVYLQNSRRSALKYALNKLLGSRLIEEKTYTSYETQSDTLES